MFRYLVIALLCVPVIPTLARPQESIKEHSDFFLEMIVH